VLIETPRQEILAKLDEVGWIQGEWSGAGGSMCAHQAIRECCPAAGDAYLIEAVVARRGRGTDWNDSDETSYEDVVRSFQSETVWTVTDQDLEETFGPQWESIVALVRRAAVLTQDEAERLAAALDAARTAARNAAGNAARALVIRDLIGTHGFTQSHYATLVAPWQQVVGKVHPDD